MEQKELDENICDDPDTIEYYVGEVKKNISQKLEKEKENRFLHSSLRSSERLKAIEQYQRVVQPPDPESYAINEAFEDDETVTFPLHELEELIKYLETKVESRSISSQLNCVSYDDQSGTAKAISTDADQWKWLLAKLSDPETAAALLMHGRVVDAYRRCRDMMGKRRRVEWPVLPGLAVDALTSVQNHLMIDFLQNPVRTESSTLTNSYSLYKILASPMMKNFIAALDGLANTWLSSVDASDLPGLANVEAIGGQGSVAPAKSLEDENIVMSVVPSCYSIIAYDDNGRFSFSPQGVRLRYVVLHKGNNEYIGATVRIENRSVIVARIVNGGVAQKTNLLHEGDEILQANGVELLGKDLNTVCNIMAEMQGKIVLLVAPTCEPLLQENADVGIIHLRALFSYEPEEDTYMACKALGLSFIKGDILHVTGRSDPNWWQAYRRNSVASIVGATGTLAGLIPSPFYQFQRTSLQLRCRLETGAEEIDLEEVPEAIAGFTEPASVQNRRSKPSFFRRIFGTDKKDAVEKPAVSMLDVGGVGEDQEQFPVSRSLLAPVYPSRSLSFAPNLRGSVASFASMPNIWSDAGVIWGQHGNQTSGNRVKRSRSAVKKHNRKYLSILQSLPANQNWQENQEDPVGWLDDAVANGYMPHPSLWTYEPVAQYLPQPLRRRPLVFVGPVYVGRHQLMQELIKSDANRFSAAPIHTTNSSMRDSTNTIYKYVAEEVFEEMVKEKRFIEWGVFQKARYGTAIDTIASIIRDGKVCCITLKPASLRVIRTLGFKPYVIFISPPERADDLRRIQGQLGLKSEFSDFELRECIETSRQMEVRYGHWFDTVIVPETLDATLDELLTITTRLEREPSWVPRYWLRGNP